MSIWEAAKVALESLRANKLRSFLTLLGIIIGITAIIAVISIINGLNLYIAEKVANLGSNVFVVQKFGIITSHDQWMDAVKRNKDLKLEDARAIQDRCRNCEAVGVEVHTYEDVKYGNQTVEEVGIGGITANILPLENYEVDLGRALSEFDVDHARYVAFMGADVGENLFPHTDPLGKQVRIGRTKFTIVGLGKKRGSVFGQSRDNYAKIPLSTFQKIYGSRRSVNITVKARSQQVMDEAEDEARVILRARHHLRYNAEDDFGIVSSQGINDLWKDLTEKIFVVAIFVVGISLVVGGIVIMNIMLVSVIERTREIGIRKAVGARQPDILRQFLIESVILCCAGGAIGIALAFLVSYGLSKATPLPSSFPLWAPPFAFAVCTLIGVFFGIHPARKAAHLDPIEALRAE
ncbi:MAG: ABC transporter permease [Acidobacteria bacterium]|nr:ABC transporter permease [Acidobacteriota bacterium]